MDNQGYSMMNQNPGYDANPHSKIAMLEKQFKNARGQDRGNIFNEAIKIAKMNGLKSIPWEGSNVPIDLVEHTQRVSRVAQDATRVAQAQSDYISKGQATVHDEPKGVLDMIELLGDKITTDFKGGIDSWKHLIQNPNTRPAIFPHEKD